LGASAADRLVLCVDDESHTLSALRRELREEPLDLITMSDPRSALAFHQRRPASVLVTDLLMPHLNGLELIAAVRARSAATRCMLLTGYPEVAASLGAKGPGVDTLVLKPWGSEELLRAIRGLLPSEEELPGVVLRSPDFREWMVPIDCGGKSSAEALSSVAWIFVRPELAGRGVILVLKNITRLRDSMLRLLRDLYFRLSAARLSATVVEPTGLSIVAHDALGGLLPVPAPARRVGRTRARRVLVVDRREEGREFLRALFGSAGHSCRVAASAREARLCLAPGLFDVAWLDESIRTAEAIPLLRGIGEDLRIVRAGSEPLPGAALRISKPLRAIDALQAVQGDARGDFGITLRRDPSLHP
jgi:DNA-binding response OmpR family regulator